MKMEKLTPQEETAMLALWKLGQGFVKDIIEEMGAENIPYTTLASIVKNLEKKSFVKSEKLANAYRYSPKIKETEYKKKHMNVFVSNYFQNSYKELVIFFAKDKKISAEELKEIIQLIEKGK